MGGKGTTVKVTRERWPDGWHWIVREGGRFVGAGVRRAALREKFTPKKYRKKYVQYTYQYVFRKKDQVGEYQTVDVVVTEEVPYDFSERDAEQRLKEDSLMDKMTRFMEEKYPGAYIRSPRQRVKLPKGGAEWVLKADDPFISDLKMFREKSGAYWKRFKG